MGQRRAIPAAVCVSFLVSALAWAAPAAAEFPADGKRWRQLTETTNLTWNQTAAVCPRDGVSPCSGSAGTKDLTGWVWATDAQVIALLGHYEPAILTADPASVSGPSHLPSSDLFLDAHAPIFMFSATRRPTRR